MGWLGRKRRKKQTVEDKVIGVRLRASDFMCLINIVRYRDPAGYYHGRMIMDMEKQVHQQLGLKGKFTDEKKAKHPNGASVQSNPE